MNMQKWAERELELAGYKAADTEEGPMKWLREGTLDLLEVFGKQGHSGGSAPHAVRIFERLASWKPLTPLTGKDDEWEKSGDHWQNKRASNVFKDADGRAYDIRGIVFWEWHQPEEGEKYKTYFTCSDSSVYITFPYSVPDKPEYRERPSEQEPKP